MNRGGIVTLHVGITTETTTRTITRLEAECRKSRTSPMLREPSLLEGRSMGTHTHSLSVSLSLCVCVSLSLSLCVCLSLSLCVCLSLSLCVSLSLSLCVCLSLSLSHTHTHT
jgi:hypothetical protein